MTVLSIQHSVDSLWIVSAHKILNWKTCIVCVGGGRSSAVGFQVVAAVVVVGSLAILVGEGMCVTAPSESGAKPFIIGAIACQVVQFFVNVASQAQIRAGQAPSLATAIISIVAGLGFFVLFLLFLRTIAKYARKDNHVKQATILLVGLPTIWVLAAATIYFATQNGAPGIAVLIILGILGIASLVFGIMYTA